MPDPRYVTVEHLQDVMGRLCAEVNGEVNRVLAAQAEADAEFRKTVFDALHLVATNPASPNQITLRLEQPPRHRIVERSADGEIAGFYDVPAP